VKGANVLLSACTNLRNKGKEFRLILTARKRFRRFREDWIETCWANHDEVHKLYQRSDICIVPSLWEEAQGIVAVEAMACGKPVIASRVGGLKYVVEDGKTGFLFKRGDISDLESKIEMLLDDKELREGMGENGRYKAATEYDWDVIFERYYSKMFC
jgi:glycosyltransferase involved in cell wall biosynthesis